MNHSKTHPIADADDRPADAQDGAVEPRAVDGLARSRDGWRLGPALQEAARRAEGQGTPWSLVVLDIDHLKAFNEAFGHRVGDDIVRRVVDLLRMNVSAADLVARLGGEEFAVLLPSTDAPKALQAAECLRRAIEADDWPLRPVTASFGVATQSADGPGFATLIDRAGEALCRSKRRGCNQISHANAE